MRRLLAGAVILCWSGHGSSHGDLVGSPNMWNLRARGHVPSIERGDRAVSLDRRGSVREAVKPCGRIPAVYRPAGALLRSPIVRVVVLATASL